MNKEIIYFKPEIVALFFFSLVVYVGSMYYKTSQAKKVFDSREYNREFSIKLGQELQDKAGFVVANNNFDPIMPNTLLRILLRTDDSISSYEYSKNLIINTNGNNIIDIRDIVDYVTVTKDKNKYSIYLK